MIPLLFAPTGTHLTIEGIKEKKLEKYQQSKRMASLGFVKGAELEAIKNDGGQIIVKVAGSRVALDARLAQAYLVSVEEQPETCSEMSGCHATI